MARPLRALLAVAAVLSIVAAVGCGSGADPSKYVKEMNATQAAFSKQFARLQADMKPNSSAAENAKTLARFDRSIDATVAALRTMEVPDSVKDLHQQLITLISGYGTKVSAAQADFASNKPQQIVAAQTEMANSIPLVAAQINTTITKINDKLH